MLRQEEINYMLLVFFVVFGHGRDYYIFCCCMRFSFVNTQVDNILLDIWGLREVGVDEKYL